ncbi:MAG: 2-amino-4-hydroxy-6-hydroxymethyldihydropteridine diphosphokinase [Nitrospinota bacterium]
MTRVYLGLGSNMGDPLARCREALKRLDSSPGFKLLASSSFYLTEPLGPIRQDPFVNAAALIETALSPWQSLALLKGVEKEMGRVEGPRWGPRVIDLDILLYGERVIESPELTIPHRELHRRRFVLVPLLELDPSLSHPVLGLSLRELVEALPEEGWVRPLRAEGAPHEASSLHRH